MLHNNKTKKLSEPRIKSAVALICELGNFLIIIFLLQFLLIPSTVNKNNLFGSNLAPIPPSVFIAKSSAITQNGFAKVNFRFRFAKQTHIHSNMIKNIIGTPKHNGHNRLGKGTEPLFGIIRPSFIPSLQKIIHSFSLCLNAFVFLAKAEVDMLSKPENNDTAERKPGENSIDNWFNEFFHSDLFKILLIVFIQALVAGIVIYVGLRNKLK